MYSEGLKTDNMSKVEFEGLPSSHGLQGNSHTEALFGGFSFVVAVA